MVDDTGKVFTMSDNNEETFSELLEQLGGILYVGQREDGNFYLSDMCHSPNVNMWAKRKPFNSSVEVFENDEARDAARKADGYGIIINNVPSRLRLNSELSSLHNVTFTRKEVTGISRIRCLHSGVSRCGVL